jgi:hypothetical protein
MMKKASKKLIALIYETSENYKALDEEAHQKATATYDNDEYNEKVFDWFKQDLRGWRFIREAGIKGVDWHEVWEHFKEYSPENKAQFIKDWEEEKIKAKVKDDKFNQKYYDVIKEDITKAINMLAHVEDEDWEFLKHFRYLDHKRGFEEVTLKDVFQWDKHESLKEILLPRYRTAMEENGIKTVRWEALYNQLKEQLEEAKKNKPEIDIKGLNFCFSGYEGFPKQEEMIEILKEKGANIVESYEEAHVVLGHGGDMDDYKKLCDLKILHYANFTGLTERNSYPNATMEKIKARDKAIVTYQKGEHYSI